MIFMSVIAIVVAVPRTVYPQAGTLDPSFDDDGFAIFEFFNYYDEALELATFSDTSILICGATSTYYGYMPNKGFLLKLLPDGTRDVSWGSGGQVIFPNTNDIARVADMEIQPDGKIVVCGSMLSLDDLFMLRYLPDGTPDTTFQQFPFLGSSYSGQNSDMALQPDGKIVIGGYTSIDESWKFLFLRVNPDGSPDTTFGDMGVTLLDAPFSLPMVNTSIGLLSSGSIVAVVGAYQGPPPYNEQVVMVKLNPDGSPMTSFAPDGYIFPSIFTDASYAYDVAIRSDSLFVTGYQENVFNNYGLFITKMDSSGVADPSFGSGGISLLFIDQICIGADIFLNVDQKIYLCGSSRTDNSSELLVVRYLSDGTLDAGFNSTGYVKTSISSNTQDGASAIDLQVDGKIVCAGSTTISGPFGSNSDALVVRYLNDFIPCGCSADFTASTTHTCDSNTVTFTDLSVSTYGVIESWDWYFEGGTPSNSTQQHPTVTYLNTGHFDVQLIVTDWYDSDTLFKGNYITIASLPAQPMMPAGPSDLCGNHTATYTTNSLQFADSCEWVCTPADAGTFTGNDTSVLFEASSTWIGSCNIKVRGKGYCGDGPWSDEKEVNILHSPDLFQLTGNGWYCDWEPGSELMLDGSEDGVDYELYQDGDPTGNIVAGTGSPISFGIISQEGIYTALGYTGFCSEEMTGQVSVYVLPPPSQPSKPVGADLVCNYYQNLYFVDTIPNSDSLIWNLYPPASGEVLPLGFEATVLWDTIFTGLAELSCHGMNQCAEGPESEILDIEVYGEPEPEVSGFDLVCSGYEEEYQTPYFSGSIYYWEVIGGDIISGSGGHLISVLWGDPGEGTLVVEEENLGGCSSTSEMYEVIIEECTSLEERSEGVFIIYPNPAINLISISFSDIEFSSEITLWIINTLGEVLMKQKMDKFSSNYVIDVSSFVPGLYLIQITNDQDVLARGRILIQ